jgi:hypothetical protein
LSPENEVYGVSNVVLNFSSNKPIVSFLYSLDGGENLTSSGGSFLALNGLSNGDHVVTVYAQDELWVLSSPVSVSFKVNVVTSIVPVVGVALVLVLVVAIGLILVSREERLKFNPTNQPTKPCLYNLLFFRVNTKTATKTTKIASTVITKGIVSWAIFGHSRTLCFAS